MNGTDGRPQSLRPLWSARRTGVLLLVGLIIYLGGILVAGSAIDLRDVSEGELKRDEAGLYAAVAGDGPWNLRRRPGDGEMLPPLRDLTFHAGHWRPVDGSGLEAGTAVILIGPRRSLWSVLAEALRLSDTEAGDGADDHG